MAVHLVDAHHCSDPGKFISAALLSLTAMIRLELPHVNVLSKIDMLDAYGSPSFDLDFYTDMNEISHLAYQLRSRAEGEQSILGGDDDNDSNGQGDSGSSSSSAGPNNNASVIAAGRRHGSKFRQRYAKLNDKIAEIIDDHSLVAFVPLSLQEPERVLRLIKFVDKAGGYVPVKPSGKAAQQVAEAAAKLRAQHVEMQRASAELGHAHSVGSSSSSSHFQQQSTLARGPGRPAAAAGAQIGSSGGFSNAGTSNG